MKSVSARRSLRSYVVSPKGVTALVMGFSSGVPIVFLTGTLSVWIAELSISMATIGVLSWVTLIYGFKLLWAPLVNRGLRWWIAGCQVGLSLSFFALGLTDPLHAIGRFALVAFVASALSATQDIAIDAWRITMADEDLPVEVMATTYQLGARFASIFGGAAALSLSSYWGWSGVSFAIAVVFIILAVGTVCARTLDHSDLPKANRLDTLPITGPRLVALAVTLVGYAIAIAILATFMVATFDPSRHHSTMSASEFILLGGPVIFIAVAVVPTIAGRLERRNRNRSLPRPNHIDIPALSHIFEALHAALISPFSDLSSRFGNRLPLLLLMVSTYTLSWFSWAGFTLSLYLNVLGYTKNEVAVAARLYGSGVTMLGIVVGGMALLRLPRLYALLLGASLPVLSNLVYADLSHGAVGLHEFAATIGMNGLFEQLAGNPRLAELYCALTIKNFVAGCASGIFVGYLSTLISREFAAVQCAMLSSLSFLGGTLGSAVAGELIDHHGFAQMTTYSTYMALVATFVVMIYGLVSQAAAQSEKKVSVPVL